MRPLWRISNHVNLEGLGGERADGRWHTAARGKRIVYLSEHPALAILEVLANLKGSARLFPELYHLMKVEVADAVTAEVLNAEKLPGNWRDNAGETRAIGDGWLAKQETALMAVPSAPAPESLNYLLNPSHADSKKLDIAWARWIAYDKRLFSPRE